MRILVVEDDEMLGNGLKGILQLKEYDVLMAHGVEEAKSSFRGIQIDLFILDFWLPDGDGISLCRWIRQQTDAPILFLTACDEEAYVVEGLKSGGDDYVIKPFRTMELLARIEALLRRTGNHRQPRGYRSCNIIVDQEAKICKMGDKVLRIPIEEWKILLCLIKAEGDIVSKKAIRQEIWNNGAEYVEENTIRVIISRLRRHLEEIGLSEAIETYRGIGYRWLPPVEVWYE